MRDEDTKYGLDSSVVVRLLSGDPPEQTAAALLFLDEMKAADVPVFVSDLVVSEAYYALHTHYAVPKDVALSKLLAMLQSGLVRPEPQSLVPDILKLALSSSKQPGFVDRLIHAQYEKAS